MIIDVKIVAPPIEPRLAPPVDFDLNDAEEWGRFAVKSTGWQTHCTFADGPRNVVDTDRSCEAAVVIAAPDGRVAIWYGRARTFPHDAAKTHSKRQNTSYRSTDMYWAAMGCTNNNSAFAALWDPRRTRGGDRDVRPLALAAGRVLHATVFGETPSARDILLAEFAVLTGADRPATPMLLRASNAALEAASMLIAIENYRGVQALLTGKGVTACEEPK